MRNIIADHSCNAFLKPGEVIVSRNPVIVSTVLGSCVAITMYSPKKNVGAICHAMFPNNPNHNENLLYVDSAVRHLYRKMIGHGGKTDIVVKLFGGAKVLASGDYDEARKTVGEQNIMQAEKILRELGLHVSKADIGGTQGRKLFFSMKTGDVYLRRLRLRDDVAGGSA
jgi:chemotaxis protein CheD